MVGDLFLLISMIYLAVGVGFVIWYYAWYERRKKDRAERDSQGKVETAAQRPRG